MHCGLLSVEPLAIGVPLLYMRQKGPYPCMHSGPILFEFMPVRLQSHSLIRFLKRACRRSLLSHCAVAVLSLVSKNARNRRFSSCFPFKGKLVSRQNTQDAPSSGWLSATQNTWCIPGNGVGSPSGSTTSPSLQTL